MSETRDHNISSILSRVLSEVKPSEAEIAHTTEKANELMGRIKAIAPKSVEIIMAGSTARGTQTKGNSDIDIFLLFPKAAEERPMELKGLAIAKKIVNKSKGEKFEIKYAEHPYLKLIMPEDGISADIVPAFKIIDSSERVSAVDRTQLHNVFVNSTLSAQQKDDVRLLKSFMRFHNVYGAEARTLGFSGYLCELLVAHFGSFQNVLSAFSSIKLPMVIRFEKSSMSADETAKKFNSKFVVVDPTDSNRNVAAVVSEDSLARFSIASRRFLSSPSIEYFYGARYSDIGSSSKLLELKNALGTELYSMSFSFPKISEEILWQQLYKLDISIRKSLSEHGFPIVMAVAGIEGRTGSIGYFINKSVLGSRAVRGPAAFMPDNFDAFAEAHKNSLSFFMDGGFGIAIEKAKFRSPKELLEFLLKGGGIKLPSYIKQKAIRISGGKVPERSAKILYASYVRMTYI